MRTTFERRTFDFGIPRPPEHVSGVPRRIILHRQGNPGAEGANGIQWGRSTGAFTIHRYIDDGLVFEAIPLECHALHVKEARVAKAKAFRTAGPFYPGERGDYDSIGIETEDEKGGAPGQAYSLSQETRITLLLVVDEILKRFPRLTPDDVTEHADWDPWQRPDDLGDALNLLDFRDDLRDYAAGRTPWRTVGQYATSVRAPQSWKPAAPTLHERVRAEMQRHNAAVDALLEGR